MFCIEIRAYKQIIEQVFFSGTHVEEDDNYSDVELLPSSNDNLSSNKTSSATQVILKARRVVQMFRTSPSNVSIQRTFHFLFIRKLEGKVLFYSMVRYWARD